MPRPEERTGFKIPDLDQWILVTRQPAPGPVAPPGPGRRLDAVAAHPGVRGLTMRQFTPWAEAVGGFLAHHGIPGFLANVETVRDIDEEESTWTAFFAQWRKIHGDKWLTSNELRLSADIPAAVSPTRGKGCSSPTARGQAPQPRSRSASCSPARSNRYRGAYVLRSEQDKHTKVRTWRVEEWSG